MSKPKIKNPSTWKGEEKKDPDDPKVRKKRLKYGWRRDLPDRRDRIYAAPIAPIKLPPSIDLRSKCPPVLNQGDIGSCVAHAIANAHLFSQKAQEAPVLFLPSRLFIYYNARAKIGTVNSDSGASIRDGIKSVVRQGVPPESCWPYVPRKFREKAPRPCYIEAMKHQALEYRRVLQQLSQLKGALASGRPVVFGFSVFESFESAAVTRTGKVPMPGADEDMLGGHAVLAVGYNDVSRRFTVMNSWGTSWGNRGYFTMPYEYLLDSNLSDDFWVVQTVEI